MSQTVLLPPDARPVRKPPRWLRVLGCAGLLLLVCGGCLQGAVTFVIPPYHWRGWIDDERKVPPRWEPRNPVPNAREDYEATRPLVRFTRDERTALLDLAGAVDGEGTPLSAELLARIKALVGPRREVQALLSAGADKQFELGGAPRTDRLFAEVQDYLQSARVVTLAAAVAHAEGRDDEALAGLEDCAAVGANLASGESVLQPLVACGVVSLQHRVARPVITWGECSPQALREHVARVRELRGRMRGLAGSITWEATAVDSFVSSLMAGDTRAYIDSGESGDFEMRGPELVPFARVKGAASREWLRDRFARLIEEAEKPRRERDLAGFAKRAKADVALRADPIAAAVPFGSWARYYDRYDRMVDCLIAEETMCALELYRRAHGAYPERLDQLPPEFLPEAPLDVFTGEPLLYRQEGEGYVLYSCGPDRKDDGGVSETRGTLEPDLLLVGGTVLKKPSGTAGPAEAPPPAGAVGWE